MPRRAHSTSQEGRPAIWSTKVAESSWYSWDTIRFASTYSSSNWKHIARTCRKGLSSSGDEWNHENSKAALSTWTKHEQTRVSEKSALSQRSQRGSGVLVNIVKVGIGRREREGSTVRKTLRHRLITFYPNLAINTRSLQTDANSCEIVVKVRRFIRNERPGDMLDQQLIAPHNCSSSSQFINHVTKRNA